MWHRILALNFLFGLLNCSAVNAQGPDSTATPPDTGTTVLPTVNIITIQVPPIGAQQIQQYAHYISADSMGQWGTASLDVAHALGRLPSVSLRDYGGHGAVQTVSLRGFATNQTTLTINGVPYTQNSAGVVNLGNFYLQGFTAIGIQTAAPPTQNPLGGNIDLVSLPVSYSGPSITGSFLGGQFGEWGGALGYDVYSNQSRDSTAVENQRIKTGFDLRSSINGLMANENYPYHINGETGIRQSSQFKNVQLMVHPIVHFSPRNYRIVHQLQYMLLGNIRGANIPGAIVTGNPISNPEYIANQNVFHYLLWKFVFKGSWVISAGLRHQAEKTEFQYLNLDTHYEWHDLLFLLKLEHRHFGIVSDANITQLKSPSLVVNQQMANQVSRRFTNVAVWAKGNLSLSQKWDLGGQLHWRVNTATAFEVRHNPLGRGWINYWVSPNTKVQFHLQAQQGHRFPSFNELYYFGYGNENLRPERAQQAESGLALYLGWNNRRSSPDTLWGFSSNLLTVRATGFMNQTRDKIIAVPLSPVRWSTQQLGRAESHGAEFSVEASLCPLRQLCFTPRIAFTWLQAHDRSLTNGAWLPYTPGHIFNASLEARWRWLAAAVLAQHTGGRFASLQNDRFTYLPPFWVIDAWVQAEKRIATLGQRELRLSFRISAQNVTNTAYVFIQSYPMPPTRWRATLGFSW